MLMERGLKNRWLATQIGMDESSLSLIVNGKRKPTIDTAIRIARALDTTVEDLWYWTISNGGDTDS
ncbi:helix-turn-helix transcriptional regulator [Alicyclobacillus acidoterrestris]|nr:helix-turn-helix transcriptional regulator [Alicyclobacillus acidoterrestris]